MFNKLVSQLPFNPSLLHQVAFYSKRLKQEDSIRRAGFVMIGLTMFIQVFAVLVPPQQSLAFSDSNIMVGGGAPTKEGILAKFDDDHWVQFVYNKYHITRDDIEKMQYAHIHLNSNFDYTTTDTGDSTLYSANEHLETAGRRPNGSVGEHQEDAAGTPIYQHYLRSSFRTSPIRVLFCSKDVCGQYKAIALDCGNPITDTTESPPVAPVVPEVPIIPQPTPIPTAECTALTLGAASIQIKNNLRATITATVTNGATVTGYVVDFGDGFTYTSPATAATLFSYDHAYQKPGSYAVTGTVQTSLGARNSAACAANVVATPEPIPCSYSDLYTATDSRCKPCSENPKVAATDQTCKAVILFGKKVSNTTQKVDDFNGQTAKSNDVLVYTLTTTNNTKTLPATNYIISESIGDILDYADPVDLAGGVLDANNVLRWDPITIAPASAIQKKISFKVKDPIPATNVASSDAGTFDLRMVNVYGNTVVVNVVPPPAKIVETTTSKLPNTGPGASLAIGFVVTMMVGYFFARSRLLNKELDLIRVEYATGGGF